MGRGLRLALALGVLPLLAETAAFAQTQPPPIGLTTPQTVRPAREPSGAFSLPQSAPADVPKGAEKLEVTVGDVEVEGTFEEFEAQTRTLIAALKGKRVKVPAFYSVAAAIERLYQEAGYIFVRVVIPPQKVVDGSKLRLVVLDGFVESVDVTTLPAATQRAVLARLQPLIGTRRVKASEVERRLLLADDVPGLTLRSALSAGKLPGGTLLTINGEQKFVSGTISVDNGQSMPLGIYAGNSQVSFNNLLGLAEQVYFSAGAPADPRLTFLSVRRVFGAGAVIPIGIDGLEFNPEIIVSQSEPMLGELPFGALRTVSNLQRQSYRLSYPVIRSRFANLRVFGSFHAVDSKQEAPDFGVDLYREHLRVLRAGVTGDMQLAWQASTRFAVTFSKGVDWLGASKRDDIFTTGVPLSRLLANPQFDKLEAEFSYLQALPLGFTATAIARGQYAFNNGMPTAEQFDLTGPAGLSGFLPGSLAGDNGYAVRGEFGRPIPLPAPIAGDLTPYIFGAIGEAQLEFPTIFELEFNRARSYGAGARVNIPASGNRPGAALALEYAKQESDLLRSDKRVNFSLSLLF